MTKQVVTTYYEEDHDRLDELFKSFRQEKRQNYPKAKEYFKQFRAGLQRHIVWEEEILFPLFEEKTGLIGAGPTQVMRMEHRLIGKYLEAIHDKVRVQDPESDEEEALLLNTLQFHNHKEEHILYPAIDNALSDAERASVFSTMEEMPEVVSTCCSTHDHAGLTSPGTR